MSTKPQNELFPRSIGHTVGVEIAFKVFNFESFVLALCRFMAPAVCAGGKKCSKFDIEHFEHFEQGR